MKIIFTSLVAALAVATPATAQSIFAGTWKGDVAASQMSAKPSIFAVTRGRYTCTTCKPQLDIAADGAFHPVVGNPYYDAVKITVVDPSTIKRALQKAGKTVGESTVTASPDGKMLTTQFNDMTAPDGPPVTGTGVGERVGPVPKGAHAVSGAWRDTNQGQVSDSGLLFTIVQDGKTLTYSTATGTSYKAMIGGPAVPVTGDPGWTSASLKQTGPRTLVETDLYQGKPIAIVTITVAPDGKTLTAAVDDLKFARKSTYVATKQ